MALSYGLFGMIHRIDAGHRSPKSIVYTTLAGAVKGCLEGTINARSLDVDNADAGSL